MSELDTELPNKKRMPPKNDKAPVLPVLSLKEQLLRTRPGSVLILPCDSEDPAKTARLVIAAVWGIRNTNKINIEVSTHMSLLLQTDPEPPVVEGAEKKSGPSMPRLSRVLVVTVKKSDVIHSPRPKERSCGAESGSCH